MFAALRCVMPVQSLLAQLSLDPRRGRLIRKPGALSSRESRSRRSTAAAVMAGEDASGAARGWAAREGRPLVNPRRRMRRRCELNVAGAPRASLTMEPILSCVPCCVCRFVLRHSAKQRTTRSDPPSSVRPIATTEAQTQWEPTMCTAARDGCTRHPRALGEDTRHTVSQAWSRVLIQTCPVLTESAAKSLPLRWCRAVSQRAARVASHRMRHP